MMASKKGMLWVAFVFIAFISSCSPKPVIYEQGSAVTVWDLDDLSPAAQSYSDLGVLLSGQIAGVLKRKGATVVEREQLLLALKELHLGTMDLVDESTRLRLGRLVGARWMVFGGYQTVGTKMRIDLRLVQVETGRVLKAVKEITSASECLNGVAKAAENLL